MWPLCLFVKMQKSRLVELLQTFSPTDWRELKKLLHSPFFNTQERPARLAEAIENCFLKKIEPSKKAIFEKIFPEKTFDDQQLRLAMSELLKLAEQFLIQKETQPESPERAQILLATAYRKRGLGRHFERSAKIAGEKRAAQPFRHAAFHADDHDLAFEKYQMVSSRVRTQELNLPELEGSMDAAFLARRLRLACFSQSHKTVWQTGGNLGDGLLPFLLNYLEKNAQLVDYPAIGVYFFGLRALAPTGSGDDFEKFKQSIFAHAAAFPEDELRNLYLLAINFCIRRMNEAQPGFARQTLDLYQSALEKKLLLERGRLSRFSFANIVGTAIRCGEADWATFFVEKNAEFLDKKDKEPAVALALARLDFSQKKYGAALAQLQSADFKDLLNSLIAKTLQVKIFYEMDELDALDAHLRTLQIFLRRHPSLGYHRDHSGQLIAAVKKMISLQPGDRAAHERLQAEIALFPTAAERDWLLEKMAGIG